LLCGVSRIALFVYTLASVLQRLRARLRTHRLDA
jgi:hypothetical protein